MYTVYVSTYILQTFYRQQHFLNDSSRIACANLWLSVKSIIVGFGYQLVLKLKLFIYLFFINLS